MHWPGHGEMHRIFSLIHSRTKVEVSLLALFTISITVWLMVYSYDTIQVNDVQFKQGSLPEIASKTESHSTSKRIDILQYLKETQNTTDQYDTFSDETNPDEKLELLDFDRGHIKYIYPEVIEAIDNATDRDTIDWTKYAYVLYATSSHHMCNAMMIFAELRKFNTRAHLVMIVRQEFLTQPDNYTYEYETLTKFRDNYDVILHPLEVIQIGGNSVDTWLSSFTKLLVFNETDYERIIYMDSDAILLKDNLDELFFLPPCKMAVPMGYWLTRERFEKMGREKILQDYPPANYGFKPITAKKRAKNIANLIDDTITPFLDPETNQRPFVSDRSTRAPFDEIKAVVNEKNFYTNIYNNLPNYPSLKQFSLTNILMVIEPSAELFDRAVLAMENRKPNEFDMDLVQFHMFDFFDILSRQENDSLINSPHKSFQDRLEETPEFLIIPHQVYGTITSKLNTETSHYSWMADSHEQVFSHLEIPMVSNSLKAYYDIDDMENAGNFIYDHMKYAHFSDSPIPKAWFWHKPHMWYMRSRTRCPSHPDFSSEDKDLVKPEKTTADCTAGGRWEYIQQIFKETRKSVCGLDLIDTNEDTYIQIIN